MHMATKHEFKDTHERIVLANVANFGWHAINVLEDDGTPPWTYTIGLYETWHHPELIIIGRSRATANHMLQTIADILGADQRPNLNEPTTQLLPGVKCHYLEVEPRHHPDYVGYARWYYARKPFPLYQIVWPNTDGQYPWDPNAPDTFRQWQPLLGSAPIPKL